MAWCLVKHGDSFTVYMQDSEARNFVEDEYRTSSDLIHILST